METSKSKRKSYTAAFKLEAVDYSKKTSKEQAARHFGVNPKQIREWCKVEDQLRKLNDDHNHKRLRLEGGGRQCMSETMEEKLLEWMENQRSQKLRVSRKMLSKKAVELFSNDEEVNLKCQISTHKILTFGLNILFVILFQFF